MAISKDYVLQLTYTLTYPSNTQNYTKNLGIDEKVLNEKTIPNAYIVVAGVAGTKEFVNFGINVYTDNTKTVLIDSKNYTFSPSIEDDATNFIKQCYEYIKSLDEYKHAVDC